MSHFEFVIPFQNEELLNTGIGVYTVKDIYPVGTFLDKIKDADIGYNADGVDYIFEHFDTYYSIIHHEKKSPIQVVDKAWYQIMKAFTAMCQQLTATLEENNEFEEEVQIKLCNMLKMMVYIYTEFIVLYEKITSNSTDSFTLQKKQNRKDLKDKSLEWLNKKHSALIKVYNLVNLPLNKLWSPPIAEESFVNILSNISYKSLEDPNIKNLPCLRDTVFQIIGTLIKNYNHGFTCTLKLVNLLKMYEHASFTVSQGVALLVREYGCKSLIGKLVREIVDWQSSEQNNGAAGPAGSSEMRNCSAFLVELSTILPTEMIPEVLFLADQLENDAYTFRNSVLSIMVEVLVNISGEGLSEEAKEQRDCFFDHLEDHFYDVNSFVRSKVIQLWIRLQREEFIPLNRQSIILSKIVERLRDKTINVRKTAIGGVKVFIECNPYGLDLNEDRVANELKKETDELDKLILKLTNSSKGQRYKQWLEISVLLRSYLEEKLLTDLEDVLSESQSTLADFFLNINANLLDRKFDEAFVLVRSAEKQIKNAEKIRENFTQDTQIDYFLELFHSIFMDAACNNEDDLTSEQLKELGDTIDTKKGRVEFFTNYLQFISLINTAADTIKIQLRSKTLMESLEAIEFFQMAYKFRIKKAFEGILEMMNLIYLRDQERTEAVSKALKAIWFSVETNSVRVRAMEVVKSLIKVVQNIKQCHRYALQQLIEMWIKNDEITLHEIKMLWEMFTQKIPKTTDDENRAALYLLCMISVVKPEIVSYNINILETCSFGPRGMKDFRIIHDTCSMLSNLSQLNKANLNKNPTLYKQEDSIIQSLIKILKEGWHIQDKNFIPMSLKAIDLIYEICDKPDTICSDLLAYYQTNIIELSENVPVNLLKQFLNAAGHVAINQLIYLDIKVYKELKRREECRQIKDQKKNKRSRPRSNSSASERSNDSIQSASKSKNLINKSTDVIDEEQQAVEGAIAEDSDADFILNVCENELLDTNAVLGEILKFIYKIVENPNIIGNDELQAAAMIAMTKMLIVSSIYAGPGLRLLFTVLEKSKSPIIRGNSIIAITDLAKRVPNIVDPWTANMFKRLRDDSVDVRLKTLLMLSHLIMHEQIRVKGHISDVALCIVDENPNIAEKSVSFFRMLSQKGNTLYNVMPDIISRLSDPELNLDDRKYQKILKNLITLIHKERQMESLVEKLCMRLQMSISEKQWCQLAYCLSLIHYNEKGLKKLIENIPTIRDRIQNSDVCGYFKTIVSNLKLAKGEVKTLAAELNEKIDQCFTVGVENQDLGREQEIENINRSTRSTRSTRQKTPMKPRQKKSNKKPSKTHSSSEDEVSDVSSDSSDENEQVVFKKPVAVTRKKRRN